MGQEEDALGDWEPKEFLKGRGNVVAGEETRVLNALDIIADYNSGAWKAGMKVPTTEKH